MSEKGQLCSFDHRGGIFGLEECKIAANKTQYQFRDARHRSQFPKGCYFYPNDEYLGMYYGTGGDPKATIPNDSAKERPVIYTDGTITTKNDCI